MSLPKTITVKESLSKLKTLLKKASPLIAPRIKTIIEIKKSQNTGISKRALASMIGVDPNVYFRLFYIG
jgi:hypothetical protein